MLLLDLILGLRVQYFTQTDILVAFVTFLTYLRCKRGEFIVSFTNQLPLSHCIIFKQALWQFDVVVLHDNLDEIIGVGRCFFTGNCSKSHLSGKADA